MVSKEPTRGHWGKIIRDSATTGRLSLNDELQAFINDRKEHVEHIIEPALRDGRIVILDRYFYSTIAYQGSRGANPQEIESIMKSLFPVPDGVFILDLDPILAVHRIAHSRNEQPNHFEDRANLGKAREIFNSMTGAPIFNLDGAMSIQAVHSKIVDLLINGPIKAKRCSKSYGCDDAFHCTFRITNTCEWFRLARVLNQTVQPPETLRP